MIKVGNKSFKMVYYMFKNGIGFGEKNIMFGVRVCGDQDFDVNVGVRSFCKRAYMHARMQKEIFKSMFEGSVDLGDV